MRSLPFPRLRARLEKGECEPLLLLAGDSDYLIERAAQAVAGLVPQAERPLCLWRGSAAEADADALVDEARTLPMWGERRVLVIREAEKFPLPGHAGWQAYLKNPSPRAVVAFVATPGADSKALRALAEACAVVELRTPPPRALPDWVASEARDLGCALEAGAAVWMVEVAGRDLAALRAWLERAVLFRGGPGRIARRDLEQVSGRRAPANLFAWSDRLGEGNVGEALRLGQSAIEDGEEPLALLGRAANHLRRLGRVRQALEAGASSAEAAREAGAPSFLAASIAAQARGRPEGALARALAGCAPTDRALKSSRVSGARVLDRWILSALDPGAKP